jgi:uncharacterized membrane protein
MPMVGLVAAIVYFAIRDDYPVKKSRMEQQTTQHIPAQPMQSNQKKDALATLDERYARGEISREEYYLMRKDIDY